MDKTITHPQRSYRYPNTFAASTNSFCQTYISILHSNVSNLLLRGPTKENFLFNEEKFKQCWSKAPARSTVSPYVQEKGKSHVQFVQNYKSLPQIYDFKKEQSYVYRN